MGNAKSNDFTIVDNPNREAFVAFKAMRSISAPFGVFVVFTYTIRYHRYRWDIEFRYNDIVRLDRHLFSIYGEQIANLQRPVKFNKLFWTHDQEFLKTRSQMMMKYLQDVLDMKAVIHHPKMRSFLNTSAASFNPNMGRKGKEGYLKKCSGGYVEGFSRQVGDYFHVWMWRWIVLHDTCISWYKTPNDTEPRGSIQVDREFRVTLVGRVLTIFTETRRLLLTAPTRRCAEEWAIALRDFYGGTSRIMPNFFQSAFPPRTHCDVKVYTYTRDYYNSLAVALLSAQKEILITSWKNSPTVLLTRPPYPTLRLDQILKYKADQGVKIFLLLYKEVDYVGQGNDSLRSKTYLESLSPNIRCIRHPNKFIGGSTAVMWSHHEKTVVIDRSLCFIGGVDLAFQRWDDEKHRCSDEDGTIFPGHDYRNPAPGLFKPLRTPPVRDPNNPTPEDDDEVIEVEIALPGEDLPQAASAAAAIDADDSPYEVEVVVDFGVSVVEYPALTASSVAAHSQQTHAAAAVAPVQRGKGALAANTAAVSAPSGPTGGPSASCQPKKGRRVSLGDTKGGDVDDSDRMSDVSENWAEDRFVPETAEEKQATEEALQANQEGDYQSTADTSDRMGENGSIRGRASMTRSSIYSEFKTTLESSKNSLYSSIDFITTQIQTAKEHYNSRVAMKSGNALDPREVYPRMPWHDIQASVTGLVARDIASHFVQRWNHHRISASQYNEPILHDITDNTDFGICARCQAEGVRETATKCHNCGYHLGPPSAFATLTDPALCPISLTDYSYIVFECKYPGKSILPFRMLGDCPVVVTAILYNTSASSRDNLSSASEGNLLDLQGPQAEWLHAFGLIPAIGDVVVSIDNTVVSHLNSNQLKRLVKKKRLEVRSYLAGRAFADLEEEPMITVTFRRHFLENLYPVDKASDPTAAKEREANAMSKTPFAPTPAVPSGNHILTEEELQALENADGAVAAEASSHAGEYKENEDSAAVPDYAFSYASSSAAPGIMAAGPPSTAVPIRDEEVELGKSGRASLTYAPGEAVSNGPNGPNGPEHSEAFAVPTVSAIPLNSTPMPMGEALAPDANNMVIANANKVRQFHPACQAAAQAEVKLAMSTLFHTFYRGIETPSRIWDANGTCKVQLLRSIGKWSTGTKTECSILNCYIESIANAKNFIYIENQFFVSSTAGDGVSNTIVTALVNRIVQAHRENLPFRVLVIIPVHPNGDFASAMKAKVVMHFEYATINRGFCSLFEQLRRQVPNITISNYIGFHSLRSWGVLNNKVVSDQVYVHDKLMIIDDRVIILGSANINDRSMLGCRDSELAIRIEDTLHCTINMAGTPFTVGFLPHTLRVKLMRQHLGEDESLDISDPLGQKAREYWKYRSNNNSSIYDQIDGGTSVYRCTTVGQFKDAFASYVNPSYLDPQVKDTMAEIKGFLVDWPHTLFEKEDLSPSLATRTIIPNELWV